MYFFVKARVDVNKMVDFGSKLQNGEIKTHPISTYCILEDPSIGLNIWEAENEACFEKAFLPHREFFSEIIEIFPVILPQVAMKKLSQQMPE